MNFTTLSFLSRMMTLTIDRVVSEYEMRTLSPFDAENLVGEAEASMMVSFIASQPAIVRDRMVQNNRGRRKVFNRFILF